MSMLIVSHPTTNDFEQKHVTVRANSRRHANLSELYTDSLRSNGVWRRSSCDSTFRNEQQHSACGVARWTVSGEWLERNKDFQIPRHRDGKERKTLAHRWGSTQSTRTVISERQRELELENLILKASSNRSGRETERERQRETERETETERTRTRKLYTQG